MAKIPHDNVTPRTGVAGNEPEEPQDGKEDQKEDEQQKNNLRDIIWKRIGPMTIDPTK